MIMHELKPMSITHSETKDMNSKQKLPPPKLPFLESGVFNRKSCYTKHKINLKPRKQVLRDSPPSATFLSSECEPEQLPLPEIKVYGRSQFSYITPKANDETPNRLRIPDLNQNVELRPIALKPRGTRITSTCREKYPQTPVPIHRQDEYIFETPNSQML